MMTIDPTLVVITPAVKDELERQLHRIVGHAERQNQFGEYTGQNNMSYTRVDEIRRVFNTIVIEYTHNDPCLPNPDTFPIETKLLGEYFTPDVAAALRGN